MSQFPPPSSAATGGKPPGRRRQREQRLQDGDPIAATRSGEMWPTCAVHSLSCNQLLQNDRVEKHDCVPYCPTSASATGEHVAASRNVSASLTMTPIERQRQREQGVIIVALLSRPRQASHAAAFAVYYVPRDVIRLDDGGIEIHRGKRVAPWWGPKGGGRRQPFTSARASHSELPPRRCGPTASIAPRDAGCRNDSACINTTDADYEPSSAVGGEAFYCSDIAECPRTSS